MSKKHKRKPLTSKRLKAFLLDLLREAIIAIIVQLLVTFCYKLFKITCKG